MSDSTAGASAVDPSIAHTTGEPPTVTPSSDAVSERGGALVVGRRWHNYSIKAELPSPPAGCYLATDVSVMADVVLLVRPLEADGVARRTVWPVLQELSEAAFARPSEAHEEAGFRYEVHPAPPGQSLREWLGAHRSNAALIETVVQQLAQGIETLHQVGLVHLNLRPETIFVGDDEQHLRIIIGGLHKAQLTEQSGLVDIDVNPYYAPPEAGGLFRHEAGESLRAWDWWALGRIVQEMVLGRHVYSLVMERNVEGNPPEFRARAEALLLERDATSLRAGAVELLPEETSPRLRQILRGLLASVRDGRWRWREVEAWLRGEPPADRYDLPRNTRLIRCNEQALTLVEVADLYSQPAHFAAGMGQLFPADAAAESVWNVLQETPQFRAEFDRVRPLREMTEMPPWQGQPLEMRQAAAAGLVWLALAAPGQRRSLHFGEYAISVAGLRRLFRDVPAAAEGALAVLSAEPYLQRVGPLDPAARKVLDALAKGGREVLAMAKSRGWVSGARPDVLAKLLDGVLAPDSELQAKRDALRVRFAVCDDAHLDALLRAPAPTRVDLALLAATGENAGQYGYVPHDEWNRRRHGELTARAAVVSRSLFWRKLERIMVCTPAFVGFWPVAVAIWLVPLVLTLAAHAWLLAALTLLVAVIARLAGTWAVRRSVALYSPGSPAWRWSDHTTRCRRERQGLLPGEPPVPVGKLEAEMDRIRYEIARLTLPAGLAQPAAPPRFGALSTAAVLVTAVPVLILASAVLPHAGTTATAPGLAHSATQTPAVPPPVLVEEIGPDGKVGLYEIVNDGFGGHRRGPLKPWDIPKPALPAALAVTGQATASGAQRAFAAVSAELLLAPYPRQGRKVLVAVAVPRPRDARPAIVLYDSATSRVVDDSSYRVGTDLTPATWYNLTGRDVVYLGLPETLQGTDLIPLP